MSVKVNELGKLPTGETVSCYTLKNGNGTEASFTNLGGILMSMLVKDRDGNFRDVVLGHDTVETLFTNAGHMGEPVGRNANRIGTASFEINGKTYQLAKNDHERNSLHSGPDYWRTRVWTAEYADAGLGSYVMFSLVSPDGDQGFPGNAHVSVTYTLSEDDALSIHYLANADMDTVFNMTNHAYFNLNGEGSGDVLDHLVWINASHYTPADRESIPYGTIDAVEGTPMDFTSPKRIGQDIGQEFDQLSFAGGYDHNFVLDQYDGTVRLQATAQSQSSGIKLSLYTDLPGMQFYTANGLSDAHGKLGHVYGNRSGFCMETQYYPDCLHEKTWPSSIVKAGTDYDTTTVFAFSTDNK